MSNKQRVKVGKRLGLWMDMRPYNKGFTLLECCIVIFGLGVLSMLCLPLSGFHSQSYDRFPSQYWRLQSEAILESAEKSCASLSQAQDLHFNEKGNINQARTLTFSENSIQKTIIVELGTGHLEHEE